MAVITIQVSQLVLETSHYISIIHVDLGESLLARLRVPSSERSLPLLACRWNHGAVLVNHAAGSCICICKKIVRTVINFCVFFFECGKGRVALTSRGIGAVLGCGVLVLHVVSERVGSRRIPGVESNCGKPK